MDFEGQDWIELAVALDVIESKEDYDEDTFYDLEEKLQSKIWNDNKDDIVKISREFTKEIAKNKSSEEKKIWETLCEIKDDDIFLMYLSKLFPEAWAE
jgi:hypothetical protein